MLLFSLCLFVYYCIKPGFICDFCEVDCAIHNVLSLFALWSDMQDTDP